MALTSEQQSCAASGGDQVQVSGLRVDHVIGLDGHDRGRATITIAPSGDILELRLEPDEGEGATALARSPDPTHRTGGPGAVELTAIPLLSDSHAHLAISDGVTDEKRFHTLERVDRQLRHLATRGVGHIHSLGTDQRWLQDRLRRRLASGDASDKAFGYSAGIGFGAVDGWPPELTSPELRFRPVEPDLARRQVRELADLGCRTLKIWVDDFGGEVPKIPIDVVRAIAQEARLCGIVTFAHVFFHDDAEALVTLGIGVLAHSVRDGPMEPDLIARMRDAGVALVPTLSREEAEYAFSLDDNPYMNNDFFLRSERDTIPSLRGKKFSNDPDKPKRRLEIALENVARAHAAGVPIGLGTDSGFKMKLQGFAQHRELQLLNDAGLSPSECLKASLQTNLRLFATGLTDIREGISASFFVVEGNPLKDITATQRIHEVWVCGKRLTGPDASL